MNLNAGTLSDTLAILGRGRVIFLLALVTANALCAAVIYGYLSPAQQATQNTLVTLQGEVTTLGTDIRKLRATLADIMTQKGTFEKIQAQGFFAPQDRAQAEALLIDLEAAAGVVTAKANIGQGQILRDERALKAGHVILQSPITVEIEARDDLAVWRYIAMVQERFPGYMQIETMDAERMGKLDAAVLRTIAQGQNPVLVKANVAFSWYTMIQDPQAAQPGQEGAQP